MAWLDMYKRTWRVAPLALLVLAYLGPWSFDRIHIPLEYPCGPGWIRLEGPFCGIPVSGIIWWPIGVLFGWLMVVIQGDLSMGREIWAGLSVLSSLFL